MRAGMALAKVANHQCLQGCGRTGGTVFLDGGNHPVTFFLQKTKFWRPRILILPESNDFSISHAILTPSGWSLQPTNRRDELHESHLKGFD